MSEFDVVPAEPVADLPAAQPAPEPESTAEQVPAPEGESPEAPVEKLFTQEELNKHIQTRLAKESRRTQQVVEARLRAEYAERERDALRAQLNPPKPVQPSGEPVPAQFQDYETYISALTDWKVDQKIGGIRKESEAQQLQRQEVERANAILPKLKTAMEKYSDFDDVARTFQAPPAMQAAMLRSDKVGELYYYIGSNPDELDRISRMDDIGQAYAIRDLETKLSAPPAPTRVPPPIIPNAGKSPITKDLSDASWEEFKEIRRKQIAKRR